MTSNQINAYAFGLTDKKPEQVTLSSDKPIVKKYMQCIEITNYPNGQEYCKCVWIKQMGVEVKQAKRKKKTEVNTQKIEEEML